MSVTVIINYAKTHIEKARIISSDPSAEKKRASSILRKLKNAA